MGSDSGFRGRECELSWGRILALVRRDSAFRGKGFELSW